ncbi:MAG: hypothetical protein N3F07_02140 [Candidatus Micrarchaeota archaeon]|nr:hypothetical protein [Candidatus Micrarchaeota archaeon]
MRNFPSWIAEKYIYAVVVSLLLLILWVIYLFQAGSIDAESARIYLQALTGIATLALLYYAYFNVESKREEDTARLELAVRPILIWELQSSNGGAALSYKTIKHPIYDFQATISLNGKSIRIDERHLDVSEAHPEAERKADLAGFIVKSLGKKQEGTMHLRFSYHSEAGGKYELYFTKEVLRQKNGFLFQHRKIISAKYPWRKDEVLF